MISAGLVQEGDGDRDALAHAAGELVRIGVEPALRRRECRPAPAPSTRARARRAVASTRSCACSARRICVADLSTGLSVIIGSWKTIAMRRPRSARSSLGVEADQLLPVELDRAADDAAGRIDQPEDREAR